MVKPCTYLIQVRDVGAPWRTLHHLSVSDGGTVASLLAEVLSEVTPPPFVAPRAYYPLHYRYSHVRLKHGRNTIVFRAPVRGAKGCIARLVSAWRAWDEA